MEEKVRYQYSYFIYPFVVKNYGNYIYSLLKNKDITLELHEKEKDMEIYTYFLPDVKNYFFESMNWDKGQRRAFTSKEDRLKKIILEKMGACFFTYQLQNQIYGKIEEGDIFFTIDSIQIICTKSKNCFLLLKTHIENIERIGQVLDFNYKFKEINTIPEELKNYEKIRIQVAQFEDTKDIQTLIKELTKQEEVPLPYVHSYVCVDSENWNEPSDFEKLKPCFQKYINIQPRQGNLNLKLSKELLLDGDYVKISSSKDGTFLIASSAQTENYTKLPYLFEKQYLYTYLIRLHQKLIIDTFFEQRDENLETIMARDVITEDKIGSSFYQKLREAWNLDILEKRAREYQETLFQKAEIAKNKKWNKILTIVLVISIMLNLYNLVMNLKIL